MRTNTVGQLLDVDESTITASVRIAGSNKLVSLKLVDLRVASWSEIRDACTP
ncbi:MAG: hypothetical protein H6839_09135 [Planctomycetes bacterium]|nr:hypothetical protein [Planctomycetota bacterium]